MHYRTVLPHRSRKNTKWTINSL